MVFPAVKNNRFPPRTWPQFCEDKLPKRTFSFWEWFISAMQLFHDQLRGPWLSGLISIGNIDKIAAKLVRKPVGTFMVWLADDKLGKSPFFK